MMNTSYLPNFFIDDGESYHRAAPETFIIPSRTEREHCRPGDNVKLIFQLMCPQPGMPMGERMWVEVVENNNGHYRGLLNNEPVVVQGIELFDPVEFEAHHIIDIDPR